MSLVANKASSVTRFASSEQLASGASPVRRFAAILSLVAIRASAVTRFASTGQLASGASPVTGHMVPQCKHLKVALLL